MATDGKFFELRTNSSRDFGTFARGIYGVDGIIQGCSVSLTADTITISAGYFIVCGRLVWISGDETIHVENPISNGYLRLKFIVDLSAQPSNTEFKQGYFGYDTNTSNAFPPLVQQDINITGTKYEMQFGIYQITGGNLVAVTESAPTAGIYAANAEYAENAGSLNNREQSFYMNQKTGPFGSANNANSLPDDGWYLCSAGIPDDGTYMYVQQVGYGTQKLQTAYPYQDTAQKPFTIWHRYQYNGTWHTWAPSLRADEPYFEALRTTPYTITGIATGKVFEWNSGNAIRGFDGMSNYVVTIKQSGLYHIELAVNGISPAPAPFIFGIQCSGSYISGSIAQQGFVPDPTGSSWQPVHCSTDVRLAAGNTVYAYHYGPSGKSLTVSSSGYASRFTLRRVGNV